LKAFKLEDMFDYLATGGDVKQPKPNPEIYLKALDMTGLEANEVLAFEDSESGIESARAAGIATLLITIPEAKA
jgi:HAD superfamily hydrolase (TIGR01509 family)